MELWIRSQDRGTLVKAEIVDVFEGGNKSKNHFFIRVLGDYVGEYETEERALEVLDEIQDKLKVLAIDEAGAEFIIARNLVPIIYEMPKD